MRIHCRIRELRGDESLRDFADRVGMNRGTLSRIETGRGLPSDEEAQRIAEVLGRPLTDLYPPIALLAIELDPEPTPRRRP